MNTSTDSCVGCSHKYFNVIAKFYEKEELSREFFRSHGVLPKDVNCSNCNRPCSFRRDKSVWRCTHSYLIPKTKKRKYCNFSIADANGTFLENTRISCWKLLLFVNHFLSNLWDHRTVRENLDLCGHSTVNWRSFCSEVCVHWLQNQEPIGGEGVAVEIGDTLIVRRNIKRKRVFTTIRLFGGIERVSKHSFVVALTGPDDKRNKETLLPIIKKSVRPGSIIYSDCWKAFGNLQEHYQHYTFNSSESVVKLEDPTIHTQNIKRLWVDIKQRVKRPGVRATYMHQYLARYLFLKSETDKTKLLHKFCHQVGLLYRIKSEKQQQ